jgi:hypothetical protein
VNSVDGIVTGLTSVIPVLPENSIINIKNLGGPPVAIMPLPQSNAQSETVSEELLKNPYTLILDSDGQNGAAAGGSAASDGSAASGGTSHGLLPEELLTGDPAGEAFTLSLGDSEEPALSDNTVVEMARAKNYEALGSIVTRRATRPGRETGVPVDRPGVRNTADQIINRPEIARQEFVSDTIAKLTTVLTDTKVTLPAAVGMQPAPETGTAVLQPETEERPDTFHLADRLTATDYAAVMELEPDLRDTFMRMLGNEVTVLPDAATPMPTAVPTVVPDGQITPEVLQLLDQAMFNEAEAPLPQPVLLRPRPEIVPVQTNPAPQTPQRIMPPDGGLPSLAAGIVPPSAEPPAAAGSIANLQKITELPYSLYLFGPAVSQKRGENEDDGVEPIEREEAPSENSADFLRLSEAVKMAAVLHHIYCGGNGYFEEETPWYLPYVRYAVHYGIIRQGEFDDYNEYATRAEAACIFSGSVPASALPAINRVGAIPDVDAQLGYGERIYLLLKAGVFTPAGSGGFFYPERLLTRSEAAAIIGRIATPSDRKRF